jgi:hypothetical protein
LPKDGDDRIEGVALVFVKEESEEDQKKRCMS